MPTSSAASTATEPLSLLDATQLALSRAAQGQLPIVELFAAAQQLSEAGHPDIAIHLYRAWLTYTVSPVSYAAQFNLAVLLSSTGAEAEAESAYRDALAHNPDFVEARLNLGTLLERLQRTDEALAIWRTVLEIGKPDDPAARAFHIQALNNLGRLLEILKDLPQAEAMLGRSLALDPKQRNVITHWVHLRQKQCKWPIYNNASGEELADLLDGTSALAMLGASGDPAQQLAAAQRYVDEKVLKDAPHLAPPLGYVHQRLRIGYLSSDFCSHAVSILTAELYGLHDRNKVEVFGFCWSHDDGSPLRARVIAGMDHHIRIGALSDEAAAHLIRSHEIDILVDLHGLTLNARHDILSYRPAPVQITWLGLPGPTALPEIDYVIADPFVLPPELEPFFTEKPLHMPQTFQINDRQRLIGPTPTRAACALPEDAFVFCCFNNNFKFGPELFDSWMRILTRVSGSVLWIVADHAEVRRNLHQRAEQMGVAAERVLFAGRVMPAEYLARYQVADLFLDTAPFNGGTTASDALWAGLPVLTCSGRTFSSRMAGSLLRASGLPELVTDTPEQYEELAVRIGLDRPYAAELKRRLAEQRLNCPLFDSAQFVRDLEQRFAQVALHGDPSAIPARAPADHALPLVSILIPTHNRPDYGEMALRSALAQTYSHIEIVISDNSDDELTRERFAPYIERNACIRYLRVPGYSAMDNGFNCLDHAQGEFFNFLMDDDLHHPDKIRKMMSVMLPSPNVGLVTSFRQLINANGDHLAPIDGTERLFETDTLITGRSFGDMILSKGQNMIGEPTTALVRKSAIEGRFGLCFGRQYMVLSDVATWLTILAKHDCVYVPEALSYFRIHGGQDQRSNGIQIKANLEWLQLLCDCLQHEAFLEDRSAAEELLTSKLVTTMWYLGSVRKEIRSDDYDLEKIHGVIRQATTLLLGK